MILTGKSLQGCLNVVMIIGRMCFSGSYSLAAKNSIFYTFQLICLLKVKSSTSIYSAVSM